jgi:hypothetical protein
MTTSALALAPVRAAAGTGAGAGTGPAMPTGLRNHAVRENPDGKQEGSERGRFTARRGPGAPPFPLLPDPDQIPDEGA